MAKNKSVRLSREVKPERYELLIKPDLDQAAFSGEETIDLRLGKVQKVLILHAKDLKISRAELVRGEEKIPLKIAADPRTETVAFRARGPIAKGKYRLNLAFSGILNDEMRGFYRSRYSYMGENRYLVTTQFESTDARRAFPCVDEPEAKAVFDVTILIKDDHTAISNTMPKEIREHESGWKAVTFESTPKMSTYLLAFIVGDFESVEGRNKEGTLVRVFTTKGKKHQAEFALEVAKKSLSFYSEFFGIPYPMPVLDLIAIPDFSAGAMENWGAITYRESAVLVDPEETSPASRQWVALVIAHEIAHQWFGNLVTMKWWTDLWLNEGFASWIEYLAVDRIFPEWNIWTQFVNSDLGAAMRLDALKETHPIEVPVNDPGEISEIFDAVSYSKGASVIRMLSDFIGEEKFRRGLKNYLSRHGYANAETRDLWQAFEEVSKKPVGKIMASWTKKPGYPLITVSESGNHLKLRQSRFYSSPLSRKSAGKSELWNIPVRIKRQGRKEELVFMDKRELMIPNSSDWLKINAGEKGLFRVDYPARLLEKLSEAAGNKDLPVVDRLGVIRDVFALAEAGQSPTTLALKTAAQYIKEDDYTVWLNLSSDLRRVYNLLAGRKGEKDFEAFGRRIFSEIGRKMGFERRQTDSHADRLLRDLVIFELGRYGEPEIVEKCQDLFLKSERGEKIDPDIRDAVYVVTAMHGTEAEFQKFYDKYQKETFPEEKNRIGAALTRFKDQDLLKRTLEFSLSKDVRIQDLPTMVNQVFSNPFGREIARDFLFENWDRFLKIFGGGSHSLPRLVQGLSVLVEKSDAKAVKDFFRKHKAPGADRAVRQAAERIEANALWLKRDEDSISDFLNKN